MTTIRKIRPRILVIGLLILGLLPSIWAVTVYSSTLRAESLIWRNSWTADDRSWNITITVAFPLRVFGGAALQINAQMQLALRQPVRNLSIDLAQVEVRDPLQIDTNTTYVTQWRIVDFADVGWNGNYSQPANRSRTLTLIATPPPTAGLTDILSPVRRFYVNLYITGEAYRSRTDFDTITLSYLDDVGAFFNQLSEIYMPTAFMIYQLLTGFTALAVLHVSSTRRKEDPDRLYHRELELYRLTRSMNSIENMWSRREISEDRYRALKARYERELEKFS
jgi:hypothetical protein